MSGVSLVKPKIDLKNEYISFYQEWVESGEDMVPWVISKDPTNFHEMLDFLSRNEQDIDLPENWVPDSTYWLVNVNNRVLGAVNIRHKLTEKLFNSGGHIGYGIRPSERRKGYATELLRLSLVKAKELGIHRVLIACDSNNAASERTILKNDGIRDTDYIEEDGNVVKRFWIQS